MSGIPRGMHRYISSNVRTMGYLLTTKLPFWFIILGLLFSLHNILSLSKNEQHDELATIIGIIDGRGGGGDVFRAPIRLSDLVRRPGHVVAPPHRPGDGRGCAPAPPPLADPLLPPPDDARRGPDRERRRGLRVRRVVASPPLAGDDGCVQRRPPPPRAAPSSPGARSGLKNPSPEHDVRVGSRCVRSERTSWHRMDGIDRWGSLLLGVWSRPPPERANQPFLRHRPYPLARSRQVSSRRTPPAIRRRRRFVN